MGSRRWWLCGSDFDQERYVTDSTCSERLLLTFIRCIGSKPSQSGNHGAWDSIHTLEVHERGRQAQYKIVSTTMLWVGNTASGEEGAESNGVSLSGTMTRDVSSGNHGRRG
jgi:hypothetical protein